MTDSIDSVGQFEYDDTTKAFFGSKSMVNSYGGESELTDKEPALWSEGDLDEIHKDVLKSKPEEEGLELGQQKDLESNLFAIFDDNLTHTNGANLDLKLDEEENKSKTKKTTKSTKGDKKNKKYTFESHKHVYTTNDKMTNLSTADVYVLRNSGKPVEFVVENGKSVLFDPKKREHWTQVTKINDNRWILEGGSPTEPKSYLFTFPVKNIHGKYDEIVNEGQFQKPMYQMRTGGDRDKEKPRMNWDAIKKAENMEFVGDMRLPMVPYQFYKEECLRAEEDRLKHIEKKKSKLQHQTPPSSQSLSNTSSSSSVKSSPKIHFTPPSSPKMKSEPTSGANSNGSKSKPTKATSDSEDHSDQEDKKKKKTKPIKSVDSDDSEDSEAEKVEKKPAPKSKPVPKKPEKEDSEAEESETEPEVKKPVPAAKPKAKPEEKKKEEVVKTPAKKPKVEEKEKPTPPVEEKKIKGLKPAPPPAVLNLLKDTQAAKQAKAKEEYEERTGRPFLQKIGKPKIETKEEEKEEWHKIITNDGKKVIPAKEYAELMEKPFPDIILGGKKSKEHKEESNVTIDGKKVLTVSEYVKLTGKPFPLLELGGESTPVEEKKKSGGQKRKAEVLEETKEEEQPKVIMPQPFARKKLKCEENNHFLSNILDTPYKDKKLSETIVYTPESLLSQIYAKFNFVTNKILPSSSLKEDAKRIVVSLSNNEKNCTQLGVDMTDVLHNVFVYFDSKK